MTHGNTPATGDEHLADWLARSAVDVQDIATLFNAFCDKLAADDLHILRATLGISLLHPQLGGSQTIWHGARTETREIERSLRDTPVYLNSPPRYVTETGETFRRRLDRDNPDFPVLDEIRAEGATDYVMFPLPFLGRQRGALMGAARGALMSFASDRQDGFTDEEIARLEHASILFTPYAERLALRRIALDLLDTYLGHSTGERVFAGQIERGDIREIEAAIWIADMRGFTAHSEIASFHQTIEALNAFFGPMSEIITEHGGEVLKFIGDAALAIFPADPPHSPLDASSAALLAARAFTKAMEALNEERMFANESPIAFALALHFGRVAYGNIGGATRLDFTVIGPAVNRAARLVEVGKSLNRTMVASGAFADRCGATIPKIGRFSLRGVEQPLRVHAVTME